MGCDMQRWLDEQRHAMKASALIMRPTKIVESVIQKFLHAGIDLKTVTLEQFKTGISEVVRQLAS